MTTNTHCSRMCGTWVVVVYREVGRDDPDGILVFCHYLPRMEGEIENNKVVEYLNPILSENNYNNKFKTL